MAFRSQQLGESGADIAGSNDSDFHKINFLWRTRGSLPLQHGPGKTGSLFLNDGLVNPQHSRGFQQSGNFQITGVQRLKADVGGKLRDDPLGFRIIAREEHDRFKSAIFRISRVGEILEAISVETFHHPRARRPLRDGFAAGRGVADGQFQTGAGGELERIGAIHQHLPRKLAAFGNRGLRRIPRRGQRDDVAKRGSFSVRAGAGVRPAGSSRARCFGSPGLRTPNFIVCPAFAQLLPSAPPTLPAPMIPMFIVYFRLRLSDLEVVRSRTPFACFEKILETQQERRPLHRTMSVEVRIVPPARVLEPNIRLFIIRRNIEGDFGSFPFVSALACWSFPSDQLARLKSFDLEFLAEFTEPKFEGVPDFCPAASRVGSPPLRKLFGLGQSFIDFFR